METKKLEGGIVDRRRFNKDGEVISENIPPDLPVEKKDSKESFEKQGAVLELLKRIDNIAESIAKLNFNLSQTSKEFDALFYSLPPEEQKVIKERLKIEDHTESGRDRIGFISGKKKEEHHPARPSPIGFVKK